MWRALGLALATAALAAQAAAPKSAAPKSAAPDTVAPADTQTGLSLTVSPALRGWFRPGCPVLVRATVHNRGPAFDGELDLVVDGITWRQPLRVGADTAAVVDVLVAPATPGAFAGARVRDGSGVVRLDQGVDLALLPRGPDALPLVGVWGGASRSGSAGSVALMAVDELPTVAAAYLPLDALIVVGAGDRVPDAARAALTAWVRGGGAIAFALAADASVASGSLLAVLGGPSGRPTAIEWLEAAAEGRRTRDLDDAATAWREGLGHVAVALDTRTAKLAAALVRTLAPTTGASPAAEAPGLYEAFGGPLWSGGVRWRLAGAALALLAAVVAVALIVPRRWGRWGRMACVVAASGLLAGAAWALVLPSGHGVLTTVGIAERMAGDDGGRYSELLCVAGTGEGRVWLDMGSAEAVAPLYYGADDAWSWRDVVVSRDEAGRWRVGLDVARDTRRCLVAWWPWQRKLAVSHERQGVRMRGARFARGDAWRPLRELREWDKCQRAVAAWQARRRGDAAHVFGVAWHREGAARTKGRGLMASRLRFTAEWVEEVPAP